MSRYFRLPEPGNRLYRLSEPSGEWSYKTAEGWEPVQFPEKAASWLPEVPFDDLPEAVQNHEFLTVATESHEGVAPFDFSVETKTILDEMSQEAEDFSAELLNAGFESEEEYVPQISHEELMDIVYRNKFPDKAAVLDRPAGCIGVAEQRYYARGESLAGLDASRLFPEMFPPDDPRHGHNFRAEHCENAACDAVDEEYLAMLAREAKRYRVWLQVPGSKQGGWSEAARDVSQHQAAVYESTCNYPVRIEEIKK